MFALHGLGLVVSRVYIDTVNCSIDRYISIPRLKTSVQFAHDLLSPSERGAFVLLYHRHQNFFREPL